MHSVTQHNECIECGIVFPSPLALYDHQKKIHPDSTKDMIVTKCLHISCDYIGPTKPLNFHVQNVHNKKYTCEFCNRKFGVPIALRRHKKHCEQNSKTKCQQKYYNYFPKPKKGKWVVILQRL